MITETLTGRTRVRVQRRFLRRDLLVLQVEYERTGHEIDGWGGTDIINIRNWRDACVEDITSPYPTMEAK